MCDHDRKGTGQLTLHPSGYHQHVVCGGCGATLASHGSTEYQVQPAWPKEDEWQALQPQKTAP